LKRGNRVTPLCCGAEVFPAMLEAIAAAKSFVHLETYILNADETGRKFQTALIERALAGVAVRVIYDAIGSIGLASSFVEELTAGGVEVVAFHPIFPWRGGSMLNQRDHQKILVIDGEVGFIGGINIGHEYAPVAEKGGGWYDVQARVDGPVVADLDQLFRRTWNLAGGSPMNSRTPPVNPPSYEDGTLALTIDNFGMRNRSRKRAAYVHAIQAAHRSISVMNSYFIPDRGMRRALYEAVERGVVVRIIVPAHSDVRVAQLASRHLYPRLISRGVRIFEWQEKMMHAKTAVIDGVWSTIGSYNINWRSFLHNLEASIVILDEEVGRRMERNFEAALPRSREITLAETRRSFVERFLQWFCFRFRYWM
jgi:cardiolipin synthase